MRFATLTAVTISTSSIISLCVPFQVQDGELQRHRRRAVDYPVESAASVQPARKLRKRAAVPYSIVQVDGGSSSGATAAQGSTVTVTPPSTTPSPSTQTVVLTSTIAGPTSDETIVITTTTEVSDTVTANAAPTTIITTADSPTSTLVSVSTATDAPPQPAPTSFTADLSASTQTDVTSTVLDTLLDTMTVTATTASPTAYYDDGMWHTYYPIKSFEPPSVAAPATTVNARAVAPSMHTTWTTQYTRATCSPLVGAQSSEAWRQTPSAASASPFAASWARNARRWESPTPSVSNAPSAWNEEGHRIGEPYHPASTLVARSMTQTLEHAMEARKAPLDLKLASYNVTRTEMVGMRRFKK